MDNMEINNRKLAYKLSKVTEFNEAECASLLETHAKVVAAGGPLNIKHFRKVAQPVFDQVLSPRNLYLLFRTFDHSDRGVIGAVDWVHGFSTTLRGTTDHLTYIFDKISKGEKRRKPLEAKKSKKKLFSIKSDAVAAKKKNAVDTKEKKKVKKVVKKKPNVGKTESSTELLSPSRPRVPFNYGKHLDIRSGQIKKASLFGIAPPKSESCSDLNCKSIAVVRAPGGQLEQSACRTHSSHREFMKLQKAYGVYWNGRVGDSRKLSVLI